MGIYDRDYERADSYGQPPGLHIGGPKTLTTKIVLFTAAVYVLQVMFDGPKYNFTSAFWMQSGWFSRPWECYRLLTYGFLHSTGDAWHILINMVILWMFGRDIEQRYGQREFLWFYLSAIVFAGLVWSAIEIALGQPARMVGASGGIAGIFALYALNFPHRRVLLMFVIPAPMWVAALIGLGMDMKGAMLRDGSVACTAHLAGALFGLYYFKQGWSPGRWLADRFSGISLKPKPKLRIHEPTGSTSESDAEVDEVLKKIQAEGQGSLTRRERRILEKASREYQRKRQ